MVDYYRIRLEYHVDEVWDWWKAHRGELDDVERLKQDWDTKRQDWTTEISLLQSPLFPNVWPLFQPVIDAYTLARRQDSDGLEAKRYAKMAAGCR